MAGLGGMAGGLGGAGGDVGEVMGERLLGMLQTAEEQLDEQLAVLDKMEKSEDDMERLRRARLDQLKRQAQQKAAWQAAGHGEYRECHDQKRFFEDLKGSERACVHFYRPTTRRCEILDKHLGLLARKHMETKFMRVNAEKSPFLCERLGIWMLPTVVIINAGKTEHSIVGFDEMGGNDSFHTEELERLLLKYGNVLEAFV